MTPGDDQNVRVMIANPLDPTLVERIRACPAVDEVLYDPTLLPPARYPGDHNGDPAFVLNAQAQGRFDDMLAQATVLYGYPGETPAGLSRSLEAGPRVRYVQGTSAGMGAHIRRAKLPESTLAHVIFCSAAGVHARMLAEFAFYGLLALRKDESRLRRMRAERIWEHYAMGELEGQTIGIAGMGQIGQAIARLARAFGMRIIAMQRKAGPNPLADETHPIEQILDVARTVDVLAMALPMTEQTAKMASAGVIGALRDSAIFINVGRGSTVDQRALTESLREGRIAGAVLDVFDPEPLPPDDPLWTASNVVMSPHTAGLSIHENERIVRLMCDNLRRLRTGEPLRNRVNLVEFY